MNFKTLTRQEIETLADSALIFARGESLFATKAVASLEVSPDKISARVTGTHAIYRVRIDQAGDELEVICNCPYDGYVCKHAVAVLLDYLEQRGDSLTEAEIATPTGQDSVLGRVLQEMEHGELVRLLINLSERDDNFRHILLENITIPAQVIQQQPVNPIEVRRLKNEISRYFKRLPQTLSEYYESEEFDEIDEFLEQIKTFNPQDQLDLLLHLVQAGNEAAEEYPINTVQLGYALAFYGQAASLLPLSGKEKQTHFERLLALPEELGILEYGAEIDTIWQGLQALATTPADYSYLLKRFKELEPEYPEMVDWIAICYLKLDDDQNYLAIRQANLQTEAHYLELADYWQSKGDETRYLETLESWLKRVADEKLQTERGYSPRLSELKGRGTILQLLAEYYQKRQDDENLLRILLARAEHWQPSLELYLQLRPVAERLEHWEEVRSQFLVLIGTYQQKVLAEVYLYEKNWQAAIDLARQQTGYGQETIKSLVAEEVQPYRPEAAIELYSSLVEYNIGRASRKYYQVAASYAARVKEIYQQILKDPTSWQRYLNSIRSANNRRPALREEFKNL
jgi:uncharacterized Zn finger protein